jgi:hypothetical protein
VSESIARDSKVNTAKRWERIVCDAVAVLSVVVIVGLLQYQSRFFPEIGYDESASYLGTQLLKGGFGFDIDPAAVGRYSRYYSMDCYPPMYYLTTAAVFAVAGPGILQARFVSILFVAVTALLVYIVTRRLAGPRAGIFALAAHVYVPMKVYVPVNRPDVGVPFFLLAGIFALVETRNHSKPWLFFAAGALYAFAILSHFLALLAGPLLAVMLWRSVGLQFWTNRRFWAYFTGWLIPVIGYLALIYPYYRGTLLQLVNYGKVGIQGTSSITDRWPLRPAIQHLNVLNAEFPPLIYAIVILGLALPPVVLFNKRMRTRMSAGSISFVVSFPILWGLISIYPNIAVLSYYAPAYLTVAAVVCGIAFTAFAPSTKLLRHASVAVAIGALAFMLLGLRDTVTVHASQMQRIPVTASMEWTYKVSEVRQGYVGSIAHWWFSAAGSRVRRLTTLKSTPGGRTEFDPALLELVPDHPRFDQIRSFIVDQYMERFVAHDPNYYSILSNNPGVSTAALFIDPVHRSGNYAIYIPYAKKASDSWPLLGMAAATGPTTLKIEQHCVEEIPLKDSTTGSTNVPGLFQSRFEISTGVPTLDNPVLIRVTLAPAQDDNSARPYLAFYSYPEQETGGLAAIASGQPPWADVVGFAAQYLPNNSRGRDLLIPANLVHSGAALVMYSRQPLRIESIGVGSTFLEGETCTAERRKISQGIARAMSRPPLFAVQPPQTIGLSEPYTLQFSRPESGELVFWRAGNIIGRQPFKETTNVTARFERVAPNGIEVWIDDAETNQRQFLKSLYPAIK